VAPPVGLPAYGGRAGQLVELFPFSARGGSALGGKEIDMNYVYVLKSLRNGKRYIGSTSLSPEERLKKHNSGTNQFTKRNGPFSLLRQEEYSSKREARQRENFLKSGVGRKFLDEILESV
jgi:putative endonuclease